MPTDQEHIEGLKEILTRDKGHLTHRLFPASKGCKSFKTIVIREIDGDDEMLAARRAGDKLKKLKDPTMGEMMRADRHEQLRLSIAAVDGVPTPDTVAGFQAFDKWTGADKTAVGRFFGEMNGLDTDDLEKSVAASVDVDPKRLNETTTMPRKPEASSPEDGTAEP